MGAQDEGLSVLLLESTDKWGGNTAMSGGGMWLPNNPLMQRDGAGDSREEALTYLEATVGDVGRGQLASPQGSFRRRRGRLRRDRREVRHRAGPSP